MKKFLIITLVALSSYHSASGQGLGLGPIYEKLYFANERGYMYNYYLKFTPYTCATGQFGASLTTVPSNNFTSSSCCNSKVQTMSYGYYGFSSLDNVCRPNTTCTEGSDGSGDQYTNNIGGTVGHINLNNKSIIGNPLDNNYIYGTGAILTGQTEQLLLPDRTIMTALMAQDQIYMPYSYAGFFDGRVKISHNPISDQEPQLAYGDGGLASAIYSVRSFGLYVENAGSKNDNYVLATFTKGGGLSFQVTNAGNVGIGKWDIEDPPHERLDVNGAIVIGPTYDWNDAHNGTIHYDEDYGFSFYHDDRWINMKDIGQPTMIWQKSVDNISYMDGAVGIGTLSPEAKLHINGALKADWVGTDGMKTDWLEILDTRITGDIMIEQNAGEGKVLVSDEYGYATWADASQFTADNLGNHEATTNIRLNGHWLSGDGGAEGLRVEHNGNIVLNNGTVPELSLSDADFSDYYMLVLDKSSSQPVLVKSDIPTEILNVPHLYQDIVFYDDQDNETMRFYHNGGIWTQQVKIKRTKPADNSWIWADFVFDENYSLLDLDSLQNFITLNKHLPDVPTEDEVAAKGIDVWEMNRLLLQKVEELTLYTIEQEKTINELNEKIEQKATVDNKELDALKSRMEKQEQMIKNLTMQIIDLKDIISVNR